MLRRLIIGLLLGDLRARAPECFDPELAHASVTASVAVLERRP